MNTLITDTSVYDISLDCRIELSVIHNVDILTTFHPSTTYAFANTVCVFIAVGFLSVWDFGTSTSEASKTLKMVAVPSPETSVTTGCHGNLTIFKIKFKNSSVFRDSLCIYKPTRRNSSEDSGHQSSGFSASEQISALCGTHNSGSHSISWPYVIFFIFIFNLYFYYFIYLFFYGEELLSPRQPPSWSNITCRVAANTYWLYSQLPFISGGRSLSTTWGHPYYSETWIQLKQST